MVSSILEVLESSFNLSNDEEKAALKQTAVEVASNLLILPTPSSVQMHTTALLASLHGSKSSYHLLKDQVLLTHVLDTLKSMQNLEDPSDIDAENYYRLILIVRSIAVSRPQNLKKFAEQHSPKAIDENSSKFYLFLFNFFINF